MFASARLKSSAKKPSLKNPVPAESYLQMRTLNVGTTCLSGGYTEGQAVVRVKTDLGKS